MSHKRLNCQKVARPGQCFYAVLRMQGSAVVHQCQKGHRSSQKCICQAIQQLKAQRASQVIRGDAYVFVSHLTPTQQLIVARLVGMKCKVLCMLSGGDC